VGAPSGTLAANGSVTATLTITTVSTGSASLTGVGLWLPVPWLAVFGIGLVRNKGNKKLLWGFLCTLALTGILLMMGCGSGNVGGGGGGGGGGGTTTGSYTVGVTAAVSGVGSQNASAQFSVQ